MNTLIGELATLNDVQYPRYRVAFKFRKLQNNIYLEYGNVGMLSEVLHLTGLQRLHHNDVVPLSQLSTVLNELYVAIRTSRPILKPAQLQQGQDWLFNWLQMVYKTGTGGEITAAHLKIALCLFLGSKASDKARFIFSQLANSNGAVENEGLRMFARCTQQLALALQENLYTQYRSLDTLFQECLVFVRDSEDVEEEQLDGGIRRQWLSQFEFTKLLTASPPPEFLSWLHLWFSLSKLEKVVHPVRCSVCARKPIVSFRYQCTECHNYHMCQMCFLKGRFGDRHQLSHQVLEFSNKSRSSNMSWHHRLLGLPHRGAAMGGRVVTDTRQTFSFRPESRTSQTSIQSNEETDTALTAINDMMNTSKVQPVFNGQKDSYKPTVIRIGSNGKLTDRAEKDKEVPAAHTLQTSPARRVSLTSTSSSPDSLSLSSAGGRIGVENGGVSPPNGSSSSNGDNKVVSEGGRKMGVSSSDGKVTEKNLADMNRKLSQEVDQILMDLPPPPSHLNPLVLHGNNFSSNHDSACLDNDLKGIQKEEQQLQVQVSQLTDKRQKLSHELQDLLSQVQQMQVGFQTLGRGGGNRPTSWARISTPPTSFHMRSESAPLEFDPPESPSTPGSSSSPEYSLSPLAEHVTSDATGPKVVLRKKKTPGRKSSAYSPPCSPPFHDPLAEFHADENSAEPDLNHRFSVAW